MVQILFSACLIAADVKESKTYVLSLRSGALIYILGMNCIVGFLGLFSIWQIIYFAFVEGTHFTLFWRSLHMKDDKVEI